MSKVKFLVVAVLVVSFAGFVACDKQDAVKKEVIEVKAEAKADAVEVKADADAVEVKADADAVEVKADADANGVDVKVDTDGVKVHVEGAPEVEVK